MPRFFPSSAFRSRVVGECLSQCRNSLKNSPLLKKSWLRACSLAFLEFFLLTSIEIMWKSQKIVSWSHANKFLLEMFKRSRSEAFLGKGVLKIYSNFTGEYPRRSAICKVGSARQFYWNHTSTWCSPVNLLHIFRTPFTKKIFEGLLLDMVLWISKCIQRYFQSKIFVISAKVLK